MVKIKDLLSVITYAAVLIGFLSVVRYVDPRYSALLGLIVAASLYSTYARRVHPPRWALNLASLLVVLLSCLRVSPTYLVEPILDALVILAGIKLLEEKRFRDYMQIYTICTFLLLGSAFISLSIVFAGYFLALVVLLTVSLVLLAYYDQDPEIALGRRSTGRILLGSMVFCLVSIPATAFFFLILPRTNYPLLSFLNQYTSAKTGFSEDVALGGVSSIQEDNNVIFRAEMERVPGDRLYWRGIVLDEFDGRRWRSGGRMIDRSAPEKIPAKRVRQVIYLEPYGGRHLFALDVPLGVRLEKKHIRKWRVPAPKGPGATFQASEEVETTIRYEAVSVLSSFLPEPLVDREHYLELPGRVSPRLRDLVDGLGEGRAKKDLPDVFQRFLKFGEYRYTMRDLPVSGEPLEDFLFEHKKGNCEYFASALAVMLRVAGVPSRLVGGYQGGYYNETGGYYMVPQKNAHVWVEAHVDGSWKRMDPTTPYSLDPPSGLYDRPVFLKLKLLMDSLNYYWNRIVLNYDFSKQLAMARKVHRLLRQPRAQFKLHREALEKIALGFVVAALLGGLLYAVLSRRKSEAERLVARFEERMRRQGYLREKGEGLEELVRRVEPGPLRDHAREFVLEFESIYYKDRPFSSSDLQRLDERLREL